MSDDTKIRLLLCGTCSSIDELPEYDGPAEHDQALDYLVAKHTYPDGTGHHNGVLIRDIYQKHWDDPQTKRQIIEQINARSAEGLGTRFYDTRNQFAEDAMACWREHNRTKNCGDYKSDRKRLVPDTADLRKEAGLAKPVARMHLCEFCPYHRIAENRFRASKGAYNYTD